MSIIRAATQLRLPQIAPDHKSREEVVSNSKTADGGISSTPSWLTPSLQRASVSVRNSSKFLNATANSDRIIQASKLATTVPTLRHLLDNSRSFAHSSDRPSNIPQLVDLKLASINPQRMIGLGEESRPLIVVNCTRGKGSKRKRGYPGKYVTVVNPVQIVSTYSLPFRIVNNAECSD
ncbi:unnamed protein product [Nezara viridula]|uniref:Uncharacterized protein n=1 Tax=Nezara viridula TaxID=85310 RepID=A0A9P0E6J1_NEZVI|nr:unnamed protein product [Nezara viridula]